jgi:cell division protein FtsQ
MSRRRPQPKPSAPVVWWNRVRRFAMPSMIGGLLLVLLGLLIQQARDPAVLPVRVVGVDGEIAHLDRQRLENAVAEAVDGSFFSVDLERIREQLERLPWIESASVRRVWPDTLKVRVVEQVPLAYWGDDGLVSQRGVVFRPEHLPKLDGLAVLEGADDNAPRIVREYLSMRSLLETAGLQLVHVWVDARQAWRLQTNDNLVLNLGRRDVMPRLTRFVQLYPYLHEHEKRLPQTVDLRYTNGFTVRWREDAEAQVNLQSRAPGRAAARIAGI